MAIDFSTAAAVPVNAERIAALGIPLVVGTTGWGEHLAEVREAVERHGGGLLYGANFSVGVQVFYRLAEAAARLLAHETAYEAWAYEIHHSKKKDAPSGTLLQLKKVMEGVGYDRPIDVASNRAGPIPGTHQIGFDSEADTITLEHRARSRAGFAHGALRAARWMIGRQGFYEFSQVWGRDRPRAHIGPRMRVRMIAARPPPSLVRAWRKNHVSRMRHRVGHPVPV